MLPDTSTKSQTDAESAQEASACSPMLPAPMKSPKLFVSPEQPPKTAAREDRAWSATIPPPASVSQRSARRLAPIGIEPEDTLGLSYTLTDFTHNLVVKPTPKSEQYKGGNGVSKRPEPQVEQKSKSAPKSSKRQKLARNMVDPIFDFDEDSHGESHEAPMRTRKRQSATQTEQKGGRVRKGNGAFAVAVSRGPSYVNATEKGCEAFHEQDDEPVVESPRGKGKSAGKVNPDAGLAESIVFDPKSTPPRPALASKSMKETFTTRKRELVEMKLEANRIQQRLIDLDGEKKKLILELEAIDGHRELLEMDDQEEAAR